MATLSERLEHLRIDRKLNKRQMSVALNLPYTTYCNYEKGARRPDFEMLNNLADFFDVSLGYLLGSEDEKGHFRMTQEEEDDLAADVVAGLEQEHLEAYRKLDEFWKGAVDAVTAQGIQQMRATKEAQPIVELPANVIPLRKSEQAVSAGTGVYLGPEAFDTIYVRENELTSRTAFAVPVSGDSMIPEYNDGDILLIGKDYTEPGEIGVFSIEGQGFVKKLGEGQLISLNPKYAPIKYDPETICSHGKVIGILDPDWVIEK